ncbi:hypothetical protein [Haloarcula marismortui]|uniref:Uncharacterized protein n=1 Tax=Haloarcula marismortui ATCC 33800 TaxID=662476 RepID=M0JHU3_9EURY|nr:hypothetical protein [Haloarcula sinaiiensis]EMA08697.1 hypothetical protein C436_20498 [Haloarcula sinaiiensis ATCC 33800]QUJ74025.1 hypothetical protein KDQ40_18830 [Haloarcula sinaiiensis ATCC 33800]
MSSHYWPPEDELGSMTDSELLDHASEAYDLKVASLDKLDPDEGRAQVCDVRRQQIREILKARLEQREDGQPDPELADLDEPLAEVVSDIRPHTLTVSQ